MIALEINKSKYFDYILSYSCSSIEDLRKGDATGRGSCGQGRKGGLLRWRFALAVTAPLSVASL